jgi:hypothetical protein
MNLRQRYDTTPTIIWALFLLPGQLIALYRYFSPNRGEVWVSARRLDNTFFHLLYSIGFHLVIVGTIYMFCEKP